MYPPSVLASVYVRGSLRNTANGFELGMKNQIDSATLVGMGPIVVDGVTYPPEAITLTTSRGQWRADQVGYRNPIYLGWGIEMKVLVESSPLPAGAHTIIVNAVEGSIGSVKFEVGDMLAE